MAYSRQSRDILFFDLHVERRAKHAPFPTMARIAALLVKAADDEDFPVKEFENGQVTYIIKQAKTDVDKQTLTLLIEAADKNVPDTRYLDHVARTKRDFKKQKTEGGGLSAHVVLSLTCESSADNVYACLVEDVPSFPIHRIRSVLNTAIRLHCKEENHFLYPRPGGSKKEIAYVPHLDFHGHASSALQNDLENGKIHGLTLIEPHTAKPLGQGKFFSGVEQSMKVKMVRQPKKGQILATIRAAVKSQEKNYSQVRISFQPESGGKSTHVDLDTSNGSLIGKAYVKTKHFGGISPPIATSAVDAIVPHLESRMKDALIKERS